MQVNEAFEVTENEDVANKNIENEKPRERWGEDIHFLLSCIAMSVGLGNVWRFPFTAYENGGGAFLVPYLIILVLVGRPIYFLEMCLGQFTSKGTIKTFKFLTPALMGVAFGQVFGGFLVTSYYCSLLALSLFYLFHSFTLNLPWAECAPEWKHDPITCISSKEVNITNYTIQKYRSSSELWFVRKVLKEKTDISDGIGLPDLQLTSFLLLSWVIIFVLSARGIKASGKASYFLALFPYVILCALLIRAVTLEGSVKGILYFIRPQWNKLLKAKVWFSAITQCFFSLNIGSGVITTYASYNKFKHNIYRDALIVTSVDTLTSIVSGITIFSILGNLAHQLGVEVTQVVSSGGTRLAFVSYPDAIAKFNAVPWLFSIMFFLMLYVLGVGSLFAGQTLLYTFIKDWLPSLKRWQVSLTVALSGFLIGLPYVTPGGQFVLTLVDYFGVTFLFFILTTLEVVVVVWWYGLENFCTDIEYMINRKIGIYWKLCWGVFTPCVLLMVLIYFLSTLEKLKYGVYEFSDNVLIIGWCLFGFGLAQPIVWWLIFLYTKRKLGMRQAIVDSFSHDCWRPSDNNNYEQWLKFKSLQREEELKHERSWLGKKVNFYLRK
ncbi:hypothetical protein RN001_013410 [Aquatica leii]|uniref:Transporter n=1 Tax=Aquatica leii TaxID=1421715 RepID=A0AAN7SNQ5_9COLE|nr:hypothetical protein RN001_013410 [Aquatica leii]